MVFSPSIRAAWRTDFIRAGQLARYGLSLAHFLAHPAYLRSWQGTLVRL